MTLELPRKNALIAAVVLSCPPSESLATEHGQHQLLLCLCQRVDPETPQRRKVRVQKWPVQEECLFRRRTVERGRPGELQPRHLHRPEAHLEDPSTRAELRQPAAHLRA